MTAYVLTPAAQADLEQIWDYTASRWGVAQAERYIRALQAACVALAADRRSSQAVDDIRPGYRKAAEGSHVLFFRRTDAEIEIVRILHQRMDFDRHL